MHGVVGVHGTTEEEMGFVTEPKPVEHIGVLMELLSQSDSTVHVTWCQLLVDGQPVRMQLQVILPNLPKSVPVDAKTL